MHRWPGVLPCWLVGCVLWVVGCAAPSPDDVVDRAEPPAPTPAPVQAAVYTRQQVSPVLTWRDNPSATVPMSLTASDGSGLDLVAMKARVVVQDPLALTELHLTFDNPEARRREGRFEIELPPGAVLSRLAMRIRGEWQEGEVVERGKARRTYETFMHTRPKVDPALLEHDTGNRVRARVFPIAPNERKEIIVSFSQQLGSAPYQLPLQGLSTIEDFDARVVVHTHDPAADSSSLSGTHSARRVVELRRSHFTPEKDLVVELEGASAAAGLHAGPLAVLRVRPEAERPDARPGSMLVLFDTSASAQAGFEDRAEHLGDALRAMVTDEPMQLEIMSFDQEIRTVYRGLASELRIDALADLIEGRAMGASNLEAALVQAAASTDHWDRVLLVSDGTPTAGETDRQALRSVARTLESVGVRRLDVLAPGSRMDRERLTDLSTALPEAGVILDDRIGPEQVAERLVGSPFGDVAIEVPGATWSWPQSLAGIEPGEDLLVFARYEGSTPSQVRIDFDDPSIAPQQVETLEVERPLVQRAWAGARIDRIEHEMARLAPEDHAVAEALGARIVELSTHYRVLTDRTALLVLETEADYRRFGIDRRARADILTIDGGSIRVNARATIERPEPSVDDDPERIAMATRLDGAESDAIPQLARDFDPELAARASGILSQMQQQSGHFIASPYGGSFAVGNDDEDVWGGAPPESLGLVGTGRGGGGVGEGTIGLGNTGLIGKGGGGGTGAGYGMASPGNWDDDPWNNLGIIGPAHGIGGLGPGYGRGSGAGFGGRGRPVPQVRQGKIKVQGALERDIVRRIVRHRLNEVRSCYNNALRRNSSAKGRADFQFMIGPDGRVVNSLTASSTIGEDRMTKCINRAIKRWKFPKLAGANALVTIPLTFDPGRPSRARAGWGWHPRPRRRRRPAVAAHDGRFAEVQKHLTAGRVEQAYEMAWNWVETQPTDTLGLLALGETLERRGRPRLAARVYGSIIDLHPSRPDMRRTAGGRLEKLGDERALALAIDSYDKAAAARPDHPSGPRLHAWALVRQGNHEEAFEVLRQAFDRRYPAGRFAGVRALLRQDLRLVAAAWLAQTQGDAHALALARINEARVVPAHDASARFVVTWETDTTDVDVLPRQNGKGRLLGRRIADVRTGYGPEARVLSGGQIPERLHAAVRYFDRGAMGHAMGTLQVITHDGAGALHIESRPFVLMNQRGVLDMGTFELPLHRDPAPRI
ncbi:MAG: AgmX/PglI C-terminal domain-containing protein [Myxococcota bacterium]